MKLSLNGIFIHGNVMYYRIRIDNLSDISYTIGQLRFFICDKKKAKRTASQEIEVKPLYIYHDATTINGGTEHTLVVALTKFTIPEKKYLDIQVMEKNGGRHLELHTKNKKVIKAVLIE